MSLNFDEATHTYTVNGADCPSVTQILSDMGFIDTAWFTEYCRERGKLVHRIIHWHLAGELDEDSIDPALRPYYDAFLKFEAEAEIGIEAVEKPFASETLRFAGTPDIIGCLNGHNAIIDIKTGAPQPWTALQLAGYEILVKHPSMERFSLQLTDEGKYKLTHHKDRQDRHIFLAALACFQWQRNNGKGR